MNNREHIIINTITELIREISVQSGMSLMDVMDFVYNSETLDHYLSSDTEDNVETVKSSMLRELHQAVAIETINNIGFVAEDTPQYGKKQ